MLRKIALTFMVLSVGLSLWAVAVLPPVVPIHFNVQGEPDAHGSKFVLLLLPAVMVATYALMTYLPKFDPYSERVRERLGTVRTVRDVTVVLFAVLNGLVVLAAFRGRLEPWYIGLFVGLFMVLLGNYMPKLPHNWFLGVRTPWTLASERVWRKTHRLFGILFVLYGLIIGISSLLSPDAMVVVIVGGAMLMVVAAVVYSYVLFKREKEER